MNSNNLKTNLRKKSNGRRKILRKINLSTSRSNKLKVLALKS